MDTPVQLQPGIDYEGSIATGSVHVFCVDLREGAVADLCINQGPVDLIVYVQGPDGQPIAEVDGYEYGPEIVCWQAAANGMYRVQLRAKSQVISPAAYRVSLTVSKELTPAHSLRMQASQWTTDAKALATNPEKKARDEALALHERALRVWEQLDEKAACAAALVSIGLIHLRAGNIREAETHLRTALEQFRVLNDQYGEAAMLVDLGLVLVHLGQPEAFEALGQALQAWQSLGIDVHIAAALNNLAMLYTETGEFNAALQRYAEAAEFAKAAGSREGEAYIASNMGVILLSLGEYHKAAERLNTAINLFHQLQSPQQEARASLRLGQLHLLAGRWPEALDIADRARDLVTSSGESRLLGDLHRLYGEIAEQAGDHRKARDLYIQAAEAYRKAGSRSGEADALHRAGCAGDSPGASEEGIDFLNRALQLRRESDLRDGQTDTLYALARIEMEAGRLIRAVGLAEQAIAIIEDLRLRVLGHDLRSSYFASRQHCCQLLIHILMELDRASKSPGASAENAFNISERARARSLLELLNEAGKEIRSGVDSTLLEEEQRIHRRRLLLSRRLSEERYALSGGEREAAFREIEKLHAEQQQNEERIRAASPLFASLIRPDPLDLKAIQQSVLDEETVLLQFSLGQPKSYVWTVDRHRLRSLQLASGGRIEDAARRAHELLSVRPKRTDSSHREKTDAVLSELSDLLIEPLATGLNHRRLVIVAEGWLQHVPFGALRKPGSNLPLCAEHEIVYTPSASTIEAFRRQRVLKHKPTGPRLLIVGDPVFEMPLEKLPQSLPYIRPLPFSRIEAESIRDLASPGETVVALGFDANRELLESGDLTQYSIIHFATHAFMNDRYPELCWLGLSRFRRDGSVMDGVFRLPEIFNLVLNADLVVLAACSTGLGKDVRGEGILGMVRAFMYAGARSVLATLWDADDRGTAWFMRRFYSSLLCDGATPLEALRIAQTAMTSETRWSAPHYWAGFALFGDWEEYRN